jgi:hypothetical protein
LHELGRVIEVSVIENGEGVVYNGRETSLAVLVCIE